MNSRSRPVTQTESSRPHLPRYRTILALAAVLSPGSAGAQVAPEPSVTLPFNDIIFIERSIIGGSDYNGSSICDQYYGHNALVGGGLFLLKDFQSANPEKVDIVKGLTVPSGSVNAGQALSSGTFLSPDLSYDGRTIVFSWSSGGIEKWTAKNRFHIFKVDLDGKNLAQLTDGDFDDIHPAWMPSGRIVFVSTRRGGFERHHSRPVPTYTLHSMKNDGADIIRLSHHESSEFHPSMANDGRIVYMRRDHIDRDAMAAHHIWFCNPDGTNPRSWGGNYALPLETITGNGPWIDGRRNGKRPMAEYYPRAIPGSATKFVAVAGPHHGEAFGTLILRDFSKVDDNETGQLTRLTPEFLFPETTNNGAGVYGTPWPISESLYLANYSQAIILLDTSVAPNRRTELYWSGGLRPIHPIPVAARTLPPVIATETAQGERWWPEAPAATVLVNNVYTTDTFGKLPTGVKIASMRIVQVLLKTTPLANNPRLGYSSQNVAKMVLGTVPVEADGSVYCEAPIGKPIFFQLLDEKGMAVQSMRSATYLHPGENLTCIGCHEDKLAPPATDGTPSASKRAPSKLEPELGRVEPVNFHRTIEPILAKKCVPCHSDNIGTPADSSYTSQYPYAWWFTGDSSGNTERVHGGSRTTPGRVGARESRMGKALLNPTHLKAQTDGVYTEADVRTLTQWLDIGSDEFGAFEDTDQQIKGDLVWPTLDVDKDDPQGLHYKPESIVQGVGRDAGPPPSERPEEDAPVPNSNGDAGPEASTGTGGETGGAGGAGGASAAGGASGVGGASSAGGTGGASGTGGTSGPGGTSGAGGAGRPSTLSTGGHPRSGMPNSSGLGNKTGCSCSLGARPSEPVYPWLLSVIGLAILVRVRRR